MSGTDPIRLSLARPNPGTGGGKPLFRAEAVQVAREPLHGQVTVVMPPSAPVAAGLGLFALMMLAFATFVVEVPQRTRAVGVLMPPAGFLKVVAVEPGQVLAVNVREGDNVVEGQRLLRMSSDRGVIDHGPLSAARLESLRGERDLLESAHRQRERIRTQRVAAMDEQIGSIDLRLALTADEMAIQDTRNALLKSRVERLRRLAANGNVSPLQLDDETLLLLQAEAASAALRRQAAQIAQEREQLMQTRASLAEEAEVHRADYSIANERLQREIAGIEAAVSRDLLASDALMVARITVRPGQTVRSGQTLMTLHHSGAKLQAWLYLSSANAGLLQIGQEVALRLDAYPHQMFGTQAATVAAISNIALLPSELDVPLALSGPVFEVRATLDKQHITAHGKNWQLTGGTSFQADLVQQRYRLYQWLLRLRRDAKDAMVEAADA